MKMSFGKNVVLFIVVQNALCEKRFWLIFTVEGTVANYLLTHSSCHCSVHAYQTSGPIENTYSTLNLLIASSIELRLHQILRI